MLAGGEPLVGGMCLRVGLGAAGGEPLVGGICHRGFCAWLVGSSKWAAYSGVPTPGEDPPWVVEATASLSH